MRVVGEVEASFGAGGAPVRVDLEWSDLPVRGDRPDGEEKGDEGAKKEQETTPPAAALLILGCWTPTGHAHLRSTLLRTDYRLCFAPCPGGCDLLRGCDGAQPVVDSAGRPAQGAAAEEVQVNVVDALTGLWPGIENQAVAVLGNSAIVGDLVGDGD